MSERKQWAPTIPAGGLVCRQCGCRDFRVIYTRNDPSGIIRRRECRHCGKRVTTVEK